MTPESVRHDYRLNDAGTKRGNAVSLLFSKYRIRDLEFRNRVFMAPMCQYSARDGMVKDWHAIHYGTRAVGGAGLIMVEATAVSPEGRITPGDLGLWLDRQMSGLAMLAGVIKNQGAVAGIQLAHAGRKASCGLPWEGGNPIPCRNGGWQTVGPSPLAVDAEYPFCRAMTEQDMDSLVEDFQKAACRALRSGFQVVEVHMAHGYLLSSFLSPVTNRRSDPYGGSWKNRIRFPLRVAETVRHVWPSNLPVFVRISCTDWLDGGWDLEQSIRFSIALRERGIDLIDCSSGGLTVQSGLPGLVEKTIIPAGPGYQVPFSRAIRRQAEIATGAVGMITTPEQAEQILITESADAVFLGRTLLNDPYWPLMAVMKLDGDGQWPVQYAAGKTLN